MSDEIQIEIQRVDSKTTIIHLMGDVTTFAEKEINEAYAQISSNGATNIIFNFRENDYINSAGIAILSSAANVSA